MEIMQNSVTEIWNVGGWGWGDYIRKNKNKNLDLFQTAAKVLSGTQCYDSIKRGSFKLQILIKLRLHR